MCSPSHFMGELGLPCVEQMEECGLFVLCEAGNRSAPPAVPNEGFLSLALKE